MFAFAAPRCNLVPCVPCEIPALQVCTYDVSLSFLPLRPLCAASDPVACPAFHTRCLGGCQAMLGIGPTQGPCMLKLRGGHKCRKAHDSFQGMMVSGACLIQRLSCVCCGRAMEFLASICTKLHKNSFSKLLNEECRKRWENECKIERESVPRLTRRGEHSPQKEKRE